MFGILKGMAITLRHAFRKPITFQYPSEKRSDISARFRGELKLHDVIGEGVAAGASVETTSMPPCMSTCPSNIRIREYVGLVSMGQFENAVNVIKQDNPLPLICGRVCPHPCESRCRRGEKDEPVAINPLKRFAADYDLRLHREKKGFVPKLAVAKNKKVAIIGAGPAGLTCAYYLAVKGYGVTIFERLPLAGGMLAVGIPEYRLPKEILNAEIDQILALGVELKLNTAVGDLNALLKDGFDAVFIAVGAHEPMRLGIEGEDLEGVIPGEDFLRDTVLRKPTKLGKKVAVVGGGNTAIDCARVALREGATEAHILYRRTKAEMPAHHIEVRDADEEGVQFKFLVAPIRVIENGGKVAGIECQRMTLGDKDKSGRRRPVVIEGSDFVLEVDTIMSAISRTPQLDWLKGSGVEVNPRSGTLVADALTGQTSRPEIFAGGDVTLGANIAIAAIACGKRAAISMDAFLSGKNIKEAHARGSIEALVKPLFEDAKRQHGAILPADVRIKGYVEAELGLTQAQALIESKRCLSCHTQTCIGCRICQDNCPAQAISIESSQDSGSRKIEKWDLRLDRCIFCGICVEACPTRTLYHSPKYELAETRVGRLLKHKEYLLRDDALIEQEGWNKPHKHVDGLALLFNDPSRTMKGGAKSAADSKSRVADGKRVGR